MKLLIYAHSTCDENVFAIVDVCGEDVARWVGRAQVVLAGKALAQHFEAPKFQIYTEEVLLEGGVTRSAIDKVLAVHEESSRNYIRIEDEPSCQILNDTEYLGQEEGAKDHSLYIEKSTATRCGQLYANDDVARYNVYLHWDVLRRTLKVDV